MPSLPITARNHCRPQSQAKHRPHARLAQPCLARARSNSPLIHTRGEELEIRLPEVADNLAAREAADGDDLRDVSAHGQLEGCRHAWSAHRGSTMFNTETRARHNELRCAGARTLPATAEVVPVYPCCRWLSRWARTRGYVPWRWCYDGLEVELPLGNMKRSEIIRL